MIIYIEAHGVCLTIVILFYEQWNSQGVVSRCSLDLLEFWLAMDIGGLRIGS